MVAITVRSAVEGFDGGRDPDGGEAQPLDVVEVVGDHHIRRAVSQAVTEGRVVESTVSFSFRLWPGQIKRGRYLNSSKPFKTV